VIGNARNEVRNEEACGAINTHKLGGFQSLRLLSDRGSSLTGRNVFGLAYQLGTAAAFAAAMMLSASS
jgi:hypothetical protein